MNGYCAETRNAHHKNFISIYINLKGQHPQLSGKLKIKAATA